MADTIPKWLKSMVGANKRDLYSQQSQNTHSDLFNNRLNTVCVHAACPNRGECYKRSEATFLILGNICTRRCKFCAVTKQIPLLPDAGEPGRIAEVVNKWNLKFVVITSPTRDDLKDGGAQHYFNVVTAIKQNSGAGVEVLVPDFNGNTKAAQTVLNSQPEVFAHNIETVPSLYNSVRTGADYKRSLNILKYSKTCSPSTVTKSGLMLGLGETKEELVQTFSDLLGHGCDLLTLGQYLAPTKEHYPVKRYPEPCEYEELKNIALNLGFKAVASGPLVRSSYKAGELYSAAKNLRRN